MANRTMSRDDTQASSSRSLEIGILVYNGHTSLDFIGPQLAFTAAGMKVHLIAESSDPVVSDTGVSILPTTTLRQCPARLDILFVAGGAVENVLLDRLLMDFLAERGATATYVTSVCTGALALAAAGLLDGYRAATHWATRDQLARFGVEVSRERVCIDRNRITGGGGTAGIDYGLALIAHVLGEDTAKLAQLAMEYDPQPPFAAGSPEGAGPDVVARFKDVFGGLDEALHNAVSEALYRSSMPTS
ncbi:DJ-1/PfpI family protein [Amycolatopsis sp. CA-126428]|uniref:DJ-1/PfpI family protein n=1 Tax=Amycolatopsis sp. CA-126428 TaxID=2073158 RepID=UPI001E5C3D20|nr:DJ-1/PfpI family protein [Amycolatopsis sp. CA-126428]